MIPLNDISGTYPQESVPLGPFVWARARSSFPMGDGPYVVIHACYHGHEGEIRLRLKAGGFHRIAAPANRSCYPEPPDIRISGGYGHLADTNDQCSVDDRGQILALAGQ